MRKFPLRAQGAAIRDVLRKAAPFKWCGEQAIKLIEHDDHWMRPTTLSRLKNSKVPAFFVALAQGELPGYGDQRYGAAAMETRWDVVFLEQADLPELRITATEAIEWVLKLFGQSDQSLALTGSGTAGVMVLSCAPTGFDHFNELLEFGFVGSGVSLVVKTHHEDPDE